MIPLILAAVGGYFIGNSLKKNDTTKFAEGGTTDFQGMLTRPNTDKRNYLLENLIDSNVDIRNENYPYHIDEELTRIAKKYGYKKHKNMANSLGYFMFYDLQKLSLEKYGGNTHKSGAKRFEDLLADGGMMADGGVMADGGMANGGRVLVGRFDETELRNKEDKKAVEKAQKETGLKYVDTKIVKKGGKMILEVYLIPDEEYYNSSKFADGGVMAGRDTDESETIELYYVQDSNGNVINISKRYEDADRFWEKSLKFNGDIRVAIVPKEDWEKEKVSTANIKRYNK